MKKTARSCALNQESRRADHRVESIVTPSKNIDMGGLSFLFAGFLAAGAVAAAAPVLIHMLLRRRARVVEIGSVRFLQAVIRQHTRRRRIRQWLLLSLRVLAVLLLSALFARPFLDRSK